MVHLCFTKSGRRGCKLLGTVLRANVKDAFFWPTLHIVTLVCLKKTLSRHLEGFKFSKHTLVCHKKWTFLSKCTVFEMNSISQGAKENVQSVRMKTVVLHFRAKFGFFRQIFTLLFSESDVKHIQWSNFTIS